MTALILLIVFILLILALIVFAFWDDFKIIREQRAFHQSVYRVLNYYVDENDQLLLNNLKLSFGDGRELTEIDHIVLSDKYVYVIYDFALIGGIYGNVEDQYLFAKNFKGGTAKILNPVVRNAEIVKKLESSVGVRPEDKMFVSVVVYNNSLIVPAELCHKEQGAWFLPLKELEKTIKTAEKDDVAPIQHEQSEALARMLQKRSDITKRDIELYYQRHSQK